MESPKVSKDFKIALSESGTIESSQNYTDGLGVRGAMNTVDRDIVEVQALDTNDRSLLFRVHGRDRSGIVAQVAGLLETEKLYVDSITFNLVLPRQDQYEMEILARGDLGALNNIYDRIQSNHFLEPMGAAGRVSIYWPTAYMFHIGLNTPDREGLIAKISEIVGMHRETDSPFKNGSFTHLIGMTHNSDGPEGGTAYFGVRANIASQSLEVQHEIESDLKAWAQHENIGDHLWLVDLNSPQSL